MSLSSKTPAIGHVDCISIAGADARRFAQTQFSGDVESLVPGHWQWNAWLTAQGRVQALMQLVDAGDGCLLGLLRGGHAEAVRAGLARYLLRTQAQLAVQTFTIRSGDPLEAGMVQVDGDSLQLGCGPRSLRLDPEPQAMTDAVASAAWTRRDIAAGWPNLPEDGQPRFLPPALGLERLGAVSFAKGCYPGQEIAARLHYRGGHKRRLCHLRGANPLPLGEIRGADGTVRGCVLSAITEAGRCDALAVLDVGNQNNISILRNIYYIEHQFEP